MHTLVSSFKHVLSPVILNFPVKHRLNNEKKKPSSAIIICSDQTDQHTLTVMLSRLEQSEIGINSCSRFPLITGTCRAASVFVLGGHWLLSTYSIVYTYYAVSSPIPRRFIESLNWSALVENPYKYYMYKYQKVGLIGNKAIINVGKATGEVIKLLIALSCIIQSRYGPIDGLN